MNPDRFTFDQLRLESLDRQTMEGRRAVQQYGMPARDFIENVPNFRRLALDHLFRAADRVDVAKIFQSANDERFEQNQCHLLRQTALMQFELRADDDNRAARVIDPLAEQVLTET